MRLFLRQFLQLESSSGIVLFIMTMIAMVWVNSPLGYLHQKFVASCIFWVNEGLMTIFFLVVGLELKRDFLEGELSTYTQIALPAVAALGGMAIPAIVYILINFHNPMTLKGWAIPVATDIAFALAVLSLFRRRVPIELKFFLLALAIFDDLGAIIIIALFYSNHLSGGWLLLAATSIFILFFLNRMAWQSLIPYVLGGILLWFCLLRSGIHPTLSGVLLALAIPSRSAKERETVHRLENALHPWVAFFIMPFFALLNAGFSFKGLTGDALTNGVVLGIALGLFIGKQLGVFGFSWLFVHAGFGKLPARTSWVQLYGVALLCGIGFTMSLFLGTLSFANESHYLAEVRLGVMAGSLLSGLVGAIILFITLPGKIIKE